MAMTTPVFTKAGALGSSEVMSFVIPSKYGSSATAPQPYTGSNIAIEDVPARKVACKQFAGFATNQEVVRQRSQLVSALCAEGWVCTNESAVETTVLQYNSPLTLPTIRRNEVLVKLDDLWTAPYSPSAVKQETMTKTEEQSINEINVVAGENTEVREEEEEKQYTDEGTLD